MWIAFHVKKFICLARQRWLTPVVLATQKDGSLKPLWANSLQDPISKEKKLQKRAGGVAQGVRT
jgi:hypothetical protein